MDDKTSKRQAVNRLNRLKALISGSRQMEQDLDKLIATMREQHEWRKWSLSADLKQNLAILRNVFHNSNDVVFREFVYAQNETIRLALIYIDGLVNKTQLSEQIMEVLSLESALAVPNQEVTKEQALHLICDRGLCINHIKKTSRFEELVEALLSGDSILLVDGHTSGVINDTRGWESRSVVESTAEILMRGPREAFVETLTVNVALLRRKLKTPDLKMELMKIGRITQTEVAVTYIDGIASEDVVSEVKERLQRIDIDGVLDSGYIEELIEDNPWCLFPQINNTERPDRLAGRMLEGRVGILVDGTPFALSVPNLFVEYFQSPDDYYMHWSYSTSIRLLRFLSWIITLIMPSLYLAIISFHQEMLPSALILSIAEQRETAPLPAVIEILLMEGVFEILREAGLRLPRAAGQAVSIVGALVIGDAAVRAGLVGAATIIVVAFTGICSFLPFYSIIIPVRMLRFILLLLSGSLGIFGLLVGGLAILINLCSLRSFGIPYLSPVVPFSLAGQKDVFVRVSWLSMWTRPKILSSYNLVREKKSVQPIPPKPQQNDGDR